MKKRLLLLLAIGLISRFSSAEEPLLIWQTALENPSHSKRIWTTTDHYVLVQSEPLNVSWSEKTTTWLFYNWEDGNLILSVNFEEEFGCDNAYPNWFDPSTSNTLVKLTFNDYYDSGFVNSSGSHIFGDRQSLLFFNIYTKETESIVDSDNFTYGEISFYPCWEDNQCARLLTIDDNYLKRYDESIFENSINNNSTGDHHSSVNGTNIVRLSSQTSSGFNQDNFVLNWNSSSGTEYQIQSSTDLTNWVNVGSSIVGTGEAMTWANHVTNSQAFYRVVED